jgi:hypothetical protein
MGSVALLALGQFAAVMLTVTVYLFIARQFGLAFYQDAGVVWLVFLMTALVVIGAIWGVFVRPWWVYWLVSAALGIVALALSFLLIDVFGKGTLDKLGPGGTVFLFPLLAFFFAYPFGGFLQWLIGLLKR